MHAPRRPSPKADERISLTASDLDAALSFLQAAGSNDCFPEPFEMAAIATHWRSIRDVLTTFDLGTYRPRGAYTMVAPKQRFEARLVHALAPLDLLIYTALVLKLAPELHPTRTKPWNRGFTSEYLASDDGLAPCIRSDCRGHLDAVVELCAGHEHVATTDITDFYARIDLTDLMHTCQSRTDGPELAILFRLLEAWSADGLSGLPVGPVVSDLLAELALLPVEAFLDSIGATFVRWRDDFLIFGNSEATLGDILRRLAGHLRESAGFGLNGGKTGIEDTDGFVDRFMGRLSTPGASLEDEQLLVTGPYHHVTYDDLTPTQQRRVDEMDVLGVLKSAAGGDAAAQRILSFLLAVLPADRRPTLYGPLLDSLERLLPLVPSVSQFLRPIERVEAARPGAGARLLDIVSAQASSLPYVAMWLLVPFASARAPRHLTRLQALAQQSPSMFVRRQALVALRAIGNPTALAHLKQRLRDTRDWEQQALLHAAQILPRHEADLLAVSVGALVEPWNGENALLKAIHAS